MPRGKGKRHSAEQIVRILREAEGGRLIPLLRACGLSG